MTVGERSDAEEASGSAGESAAAGAEGVSRGGASPFDAAGQRRSVR